jgi:hypothetical protein
MVSINGGLLPQWRTDGKELFYYGIDGKLMAVAVKANGSNFEAGSPNPPFRRALDTRCTDRCCGLCRYT